MPGRKVTIGLIQAAVVEDSGENLERIRKRIDSAINQGAEILCLQELFTAPYFPQYHKSDAMRYAESIPGPTTSALSLIARKNGVVIIAPIFEKEADGHFYNSAAVIEPDGSIGAVYRKIHIPEDPLYHEKEYFSPSGEYVVADTPFARVGVLICYDQWFPEAARAATLRGAEILVYPTAIGYIRNLADPCEGDWREAWETVQRGHAIANGVHVAAVNRVGIEGNLEFFGGSFVCDAFGNVLCRAGDGEEVLVTEIDLEMNSLVREGWGFLKNRRPDTYGSLLNAVRGETEGIPKDLGFRMPAEWEPHEAVWLAWPLDNSTFPDLAAVEETYVGIVRALHQRERVHLLVPGKNECMRVAGRLGRSGIDVRQVRMHLYPYADVWFRDYGPTFLVHQKTGQLSMVNWRFNAWGMKYPELAADGSVPGYISRTSGIPAFSPGIVLEGGSIDVNGRGTILTTEQCLLNENRNPGLTRMEIEERLLKYLGASRVIWLKGGIAGDDTDGHIDDVARFADERTILCAVEEKGEDENYAILRENFRILTRARDQDGRHFRIVPMPMPGDLYSDGSRLPASYTNFYIANGVVLAPTFQDPNDSCALEILRGVFPGRQVIGIDCRAMVAGMGAIHCITQQHPAP
jgi:agmatine deiminase